MNKPLREYLNDIGNEMRTTADKQERNNLYQNAVGALTLYNISEGLNTKNRNFIEEFEYNNGKQILNALKELI